MLVRRTDENLDRVGASLAELNARLRAEGLSDEAAKALPRLWDRGTLARMEIATLRTDYGDLDVLTDIPGPGGRLTYEDLVGDATEILLAPGLTIRIASVEAIVASKESADRPKDREALPELRQIADRSRQSPEMSEPEDSTDSQATGTT